MTNQPIINQIINTLTFIGLFSSFLYLAIQDNTDMKIVWKNKHLQCSHQWTNLQFSDLIYFLLQYINVMSLSWKFYNMSESFEFIHSFIDVTSAIYQKEIQFLSMFNTLSD